LNVIANLKYIIKVCA